jgi:hypothetical protein
MPYYLAMRTVDVIGVTAWNVRPRESNRTVHEILRVVTGTQQELEGSATDTLGDGRTKWMAITALADGDVRYWRTAREETNQQEIATSMV